MVRVPPTLEVVELVSHVEVDDLIIGRRTLHRQKLQLEVPVDEIAAVDVVHIVSYAYAQFDTKPMLNLST